MMFNETLKERFISSNNVYDYEEIFNITSTKENELQKDLYEFDLNDLESVFKKVKFRSRVAAMRFFIKIRDYIDWTMMQGFSNTNINLMHIVSEEWFDQFSYNQ